MQLLVRTKAVLRYLTSVVAVFLLAGCVIGIARVTYSAPMIDDPKVETRHVSGVPVDKMFLLEDVDYYVYPRNEKNREDVVLLPLPGVYKYSKSMAPTFIIAIGLRPNRAGFVIDPSQTRVIRSSEDILKPTRVIASGDCDNKTRYGSSDFPMPPLVLLKGVCTAFVLEFAISTPDPSESFSVQVAGITVDGVARNIPIVHFRERKRLDQFGAP